MKQIETEILIEATPEKIWSILTDFTNHPKWNPFIKSIRGEKKIGEKLTVSIESPGGNGMTFQPIVTSFKENVEFRWKGKLGLRGIFDGEHYFQLIRQENNRTKLIHGEQFSGILVPLMGKALDKTKDGFELMNRSLKIESEKG
ncbi:SRPBCC domain-containing protein [Haliscomenobacter hydrossis]|uniref:Polyketide cyclase/dehydrase n=1 Tax=Haliscomenobacter hydrossis (strain ATCC 27775 / DSM 1100 / LMG 10767 / O) TaxID=760192 RepID=F4L5T7_HALH1|nr:SRPBCC domain-containing protein [Haliscomenobacter hydrossis]AEE52047.1 Polyketide cyclase/dehydrase [Haliscomenobacter hydrossis DSM 1100]